MDLPIDDHPPDEEECPVDPDVLDEHHTVSDEEDDDIEEEDIELQETTKYTQSTTTTLCAPLRGSRHPDLPSDLHPEPETP